MIKTPIVREGYIYIILLALITLITMWGLNIYWSIVPLVLTIFVTFFFRNPERNIVDDESLILSPADGKVMGVSEPFYEEEFLNREAVKVTIFLSIFNVHVNRSPISGEIKFREYTCGRFRPAYKASVTWENERHTIGVENGDLRIIVTQIAGLIARRIVSWVALGSCLKQGDRYGMIKFGSCTEIIVPKEVEILVKKGDKVKGGITVIGKVANS
ncbi:phosphatidylserine decarboxylase family protein [Selenomonadales bacterium OttesenSCG-928-I06]|nr:phosphatidylserine decarboxylase family protein [Selenomonadales bacterium OttesenSCG-928-I06]